MKKRITLITLLLLITSQLAIAEDRVSACVVLELQGYGFYCLVVMVDENTGYNLENYADFSEGDTVFISGAIAPGYFCNFSPYPVLMGNLIFPCTNCCIERGDVDGIGNVNILDLTYTVDYIFRGGIGPPCEGQADVNSDGESANIQDLTFLVDFIFRGGPYPESCPSFP